MEDNGEYATKEKFLYQKQCKKCSNMFVQKNGENDKKKYSITQKTPCYLCENQACTYCICGECYKREFTLYERKNNLYEKLYTTPKKPLYVAYRVKL